MLRGGGEKKSFGTKLKQLLKCCFSFHNPTDSEIRERERELAIRMGKGRGRLLVWR
jgi:hypothetical protein